MSDFEKQWLQKLKTGLQKIGREDIYDNAMRTHREDVNWNVQLLEKLKEELSEDELINVMCGCACLAPKDYLKILQVQYKQNKDIKQVHQLLQDYFFGFIKEYKNLSKKHLKYIVDNNMGMAGTLDGNVITAVKIPKEFHEYFQTNDRTAKRYRYCHCPRIREALKSKEKPVDKNYCYCGAGFYRDIWEFILQRPVQVELVESLIQGDEQCKIKIYIGGINYV